MLIAHILLFIFPKTIYRKNSIKFFWELPVKVEWKKVGEIIGSFNLQVLQRLSENIATMGNAPIMLFLLLYLSNNGAFNFGTLFGYAKKH